MTTLDDLSGASSGPRVAIDRNRLRELRKEQRLTQYDLSVKAGLSRLTVHNVESGKTQPYLSTALLLAEALGVDPVVLLGDPIIYAPRRERTR